MCLIGDGPVPADVMIVGEAPGFREDEIHKPFAGKSGQLLDRELAKVGLHRKDIFLTNVNKCRPPDNDTPNKTQMKACRPYLDAEIEAVKPKFILTVGNTALSVIKKSGIMKHRGEVYNLDDAVVFPTVHPAAVLRNPRYERLFQTDLSTFARIVRGEPSKTPATKVYLVTDKRTLKVMCRAIMSAATLAYDLETTGTDAHHPEAQVVTIAVSPKPGVSFVVPIGHPEARWKDPVRILGIVGRAMMYSGAKIIAHNATFDDRWMHRFGVPVDSTFDTMVAAHILDENRYKGLKVLAPMLLGVDPWKDIDPGKAMETPIRPLARYNAKDADYTHRLYYTFRRELTQRGNERTLRLFVKLLMPASHAVTDVILHGMWLDPKRLNKRLIQVNEKLAKIDRKLRKATGTDANWNSTQQLAAILFGKLGLDPIEFTPKGAESTKESVLLQLRDESPVVGLILEWRKWFKWRSTYLQRWKDVKDENNRMHPNYKMTGTVTGRLSSGKDENANRKERGLNVQQVPRDPFIRSIIGAPPGWKFVEADFSQVELRIAAHMSQDREMMRVFRMDEDPHLQMAMTMTGKPAHRVEKEERKKAKAVNFGFLYGMGAKKFVIYARDNYEVVVELDEAEDFRDKFFERYADLQRWHARQRRLVNQYKQVQSPIGRVRHLPDVDSEDKEVRAEAERQGINSPVQSLASDMMLLSMILLHEQMPPDEARIVGTVHDSLLFEIREDRVAYWAPRIKFVMEHLPLKKKFGCTLSVPIKVDVKIGDHWSEGEEVAA